MAIERSAESFRSLNIVPRLWEASNPMVQPHRGNYELAKQKQELSVAFNATMQNAYAQYDAPTRTIIYGYSTLDFSKESLLALTRHEKTHDWFEHLTKSDQERIAVGFMRYPFELMRFYYHLRNGAYTDDYFDYTTSQEGAYDLAKAGFNRHVEHVDFVDGSSVKAIDVIPIVNELLAFYNSYEPGNDEYGKSPWQTKAVKLARIIFSLLDKQTQLLLHEKGFQSIDPSDQVQQYYATFEYRRSQQIKLLS